MVLHPKHIPLVVKDNYKPNRTLAAITAMNKIKGYNPEAGDWFWVKYAPDGKALKKGKPAGCIGTKLWAHL